MSEPAVTTNRIAVVATGGTIASVRTGESGAVAVGMSVSKLLADVGDAASVDAGPVEELAQANG